MVVVCGCVLAISQRYRSDWRVSAICQNDEAKCEMLV